MAEPGVAIRRLAEFSTHEATVTAMTFAGERAGLEVTLLTGEQEEARALAAAGSIAWHAPGGFLTRLSAAGAPVRLSGATPRWFVELPEAITGRSLRLTDAMSAASLLRSAPRVVKLADGKHPMFPVRRMVDDGDLRDALAAAGLPATTELIVADTWLTFDSEYRVFTIGREPVAWSPYLIEDEGWGQFLHWHRASWHEEAAAFVAATLGDLPVDLVPPAAVLDVGRTPDGGFVLIEANNPWSSGLYGCDPDEVLRSVLVANDPLSAGPDERWLWRPDLSVLSSRRGGQP